jgi:hypothetical protein
MLPDLKEFKENLLPYAVADFLWAYVSIIIKVFWLDLNSRHFIPGCGIYMPSYLLMYLKTKLVVIPYLILSICGYVLG